MKDKKKEALLNKALIKVRSLIEKNTDPERAEILKIIEESLSRPVYRNLTVSILSNIKDDQLEQTIFDSISANIEDDKRQEKELVKLLTAGQRAIYITWIVEAEVRNGGFNQFYFNSSGELADMAEEAFRTISASKIANLIKKANLIRDEMDLSFQSSDSDTVGAFKNFRDRHPLNNLDDEFYRLAKEESLTSLKIEYIRNNLDQFVSA